MPDFPEQHSEKSIERRDRSEHTRDSLSRSGPSDTAILQSLPIGIVAFDSDLKIVMANPVVAQLIEIGQTIDTSLAKGTDGKIWQGWTQLLTSALSTGQTALFDDVDYTFNGKTRRLRILCSALKATPTTKILGGTMMIEDVTETGNMHRRLANAERLAIVGKHVSKVAHELNNPLDGILRYVNLAMRIVERENLEKPIEYLAQCRRGLMRMIKIVGDLLEYSRSAYAPMEYTKVEQIILNAQQHGIELGIGRAQVHAHHSDAGIGLVDRAVGGDAQCVLWYPLAASERCGAFVAGACVDLAEYDHVLLFQ